MKKIFNLMLALLAIVGLACTPNSGVGDEGKALSFAISVTNITSDGAIVTIEPSNNDTYYFDVIEKSVFEQFDSENAIAEIVESVKAYCESKGYSVGDVVASGKKEYSLEWLLEAGTEYYAYAFGLSKDGIVTTDITLVPFKTLANEDISSGIDSGDKNIEGLVRGNFVNYGDYYDVGATNWMLALYNESGLGALVIEVQTAPSATEIPLGEYPIDSSLSAGTVISGALNSDSISYGTIWTLYDDSWVTMLENIFCKSGKVVLDKRGDDYIVNLEAIDAYGNTITMSYTGALERLSFDESSTALKLNRHAFLSHKVVPTKRD